jgi:hypothetical protein
MWYAGIDWANAHHVGVVLDENGQQMATKQFPRTVEGLAQLTTLRVEHRWDSGAQGGAGVHH